MSAYATGYNRVMKVAKLRAEEEPQKAQEVYNEMEMRFSPGGPLRSSEDVSTPRVMLSTGGGGGLIGGLSGLGLGGALGRPGKGGAIGALLGTTGGALAGIPRADTLRERADSHPHDEYSGMSDDELAELFNAYFSEQDAQ